MKRQKSELNTEQIVARVTPEMKAEIEEYCARKGMSIADWVRCCATQLGETKRASLRPRAEAAGTEQAGEGEGEAGT